MRRPWRFYRLSLMALLGLVFWSGLATPSQAHWADLAVAEIIVEQRQVRMTLTFPTGLLALAAPDAPGSQAPVVHLDEDRDGQLSAAEIRQHRAELQTFLAERIRLSDSRSGRSGALTVAPSEAAALPSELAGPATGTHSTVHLVYTWSQPLQALSIHYDLFLPGLPSASCLATLVGTDQVQTFIFTPDHRELALAGKAGPLVWQFPWLAALGRWLAAAAVTLGLFWLVQRLLLAF